MCFRPVHGKNGQSFCIVTYVFLIGNLVSIRAVSCMQIITFHRSMEDKSLQVKNTLKDFATWQSLPAKDALQNFSDLKSHLEMTGSMSTELTPNVKHDTKISFMRPHSELFSLIENQGRLEFSDPRVVGDINNMSVDSDVVTSDVSQTKNGPHSFPQGDEQPPSKRKKLS